jgi:hypothetical protein
MVGFVPELEHFDLVVIGAGPAGEKAAAQAAYFKKRVAIIESEPEPGGAAVHTGTLPSKTLRETALYLSGYHARELYGVALEVDRSATLPRLMSRKNAIAAAEARSFRQNFARHEVRYLQGHGRMLDEHTVSITSASGEQRLKADFVLIATGWSARAKKRCRISCARSRPARRCRASKACSSRAKAARRRYRSWTRAAWRAVSRPRGARWCMILRRRRAAKRGGGSTSNSTPRTVARTRCKPSAAARSNAPTACTTTSKVTRIACATR